MKYSIFTNGTLFVAVSNDCHLTKSDKLSNGTMVSSAMYNLFSIDSDFVFVCVSDSLDTCDFLITYKE